MSVHDGHRDRMRKRIIENGINSLEEHEILEYLLYSFIPRKDTNEIAHNLLDTFGSLKEVFDAPIERLERVKNISRNIAVFLSSMSELSRRYMSLKEDDDIYIINTQSAVQLMMPIMSTKRNEEIHMLIKDNTGKLLKRVVMSKGIVNEAFFRVREAVDTVFKHNGVSVVLVHNHPSGVPEPSYNDIKLTEQFCLACLLVGIRVDDHLIIAGHRYYSFKENGYIDKIANGRLCLTNGIIKDIEY